MTTASSSHCNRSESLIYQKKLRSTELIPITCSHAHIVNPRLRMRSEGYSSRSVCLCVCECVCVCVYDYSRTTGYEAAYERYQQLQCYKGRKNNVAILLKRLRWRDMA